MYECLIGAKSLYVTLNGLMRLQNSKRKLEKKINKQHHEKCQRDKQQISEKQIHYKKESSICCCLQELIMMIGNISVVRVVAGPC
jgi:hypothetical protein